MASDLRNLAPSVLIACCWSSRQATSLGELLSERSFGTALRGYGGEGGRSSEEDYQERFRWFSRGKILVGGRDGFVKEITNKGEWKTPRNGKMVVADIDFVVDVQGMMNMRVAAIVDDSTVVERRHRDLETWNLLGEELLLKTVRVVAYKDSADGFLNMLRDKCKHVQVSNMCGRQASLFVLGPIGKTKPQFHKNLCSYNVTETDRTERWTKIQEVKLKMMQQREACAISTVVILGSNQGRRGVEGLERRHKRDERRVDKRGGSQWNKGAD